MNKFKIGDWVIERGTTKPRQLTSKCIDAINTVGSWEDFKLWQPKVGEWCWFYNYNVDIPNFLIFTGLSEDGLFYGASCVGGCGIEFDYCEPLIGTLPSFIKETK